MNAQTLGPLDERSRAIELKEKEIAEKQNQIDKDLDAADLIVKTARIEADKLLSNAKAEVEGLLLRARSEYELNLQESVVRRESLERLKTEIEAPLKDAENTIKSLQGVFNLEQDKVRVLELAITAQISKYKRLSRRFEDRAVKMTLLEAERDAAKTAQIETAARNRKLQREVDAAERCIASAVGRLIAHCPLTLAWLSGLQDACKGLDWLEDIATTGNDPFTVEFIDSILRREGKQPNACGSPTAGVLVVGREGWTINELQKQIDRREGSDLRIYSQEMAAIALLTGNDPFDAGEEVLLEMGKGHPALELLMLNPFKWPSIRERYDGDIVVDADLWRQHSPLTAMGYRVGVTSTLSNRERRKILSRIFKGRLVFPDNFSQSEQLKWGGAGTQARLRKMVFHIIGNISLHRTRLEYKIAVNEWKVDLVWLKNAFYTKDLKFRWPDTSV